MTLHPIMSYELAVNHDRAMQEAAEARRVRGEALREQTTATKKRLRLAGLGLIMIAVGERLSGVNLPKPTDMASSPR